MWLWLVVVLVLVDVVAVVVVIVVVIVVCFHSGPTFIIFAIILWVKYILVCT